MAAILRRMSNPIALLAIQAISDAAMHAVTSEGTGVQHKKLILLLLSQTVVQVYLLCRTPLYQLIKQEM